MARSRLSALHFLGNTVPMISGIATAPFSARALGVDGRATVVVVTAVSVGLLILGTFGLAWISRRELSVDITTSRTWKARALRVDAFSFLPAAIAGAGLSVLLDVTLVEALPLCLVIVLSTLSAVRAVWANTLIASGRSWGYGVANLLATGVIVIATIGLYFAGSLNLASALWIQFVGLMIQTLTVAVLAERVPGARGFAIHAGPWLRTWRTKIRRSVGGQVADFAVGRSDLLIVALAGSQFEIGLYSVPGLIAIVVYHVSVTVVQHSWSPGVAKSDRERAAISWQVSVAAGALVTVVCGLGVWLVFLPLFGEAFEPSQAYILPACTMAIGISSVVPAVQHSSTAGGRNHVALIALGVVAVAALLATTWAPEPTIAVGVLAAGLFVAGAGYIMSVSGWVALAPRWTALRRFIRG